MIEQAHLADGKVAKDPEIQVMLKRMDENISIGTELSKQLAARLTPVLNDTATAMEKAVERKQSTVPLVQLLDKFNDSIKQVNGTIVDILNRIEV